MITRPPARPQSFLRAFVKQSVRTQSSKPSQIFKPKSNIDLSFKQSQCRRQHTVPKDWKLMKSPTWQNQTKKEVFDNYGVPGFLSKDTFSQTYQKYIEHLAGRLNEFVAGTADEGASADDLHKRYAHVAQKAALYNHAAMAIHTQFFFEGLAHAPSSAVPRTPGMNTKKSIDTYFDSVDQLRTEFLETADSLFGNGFVWLMLLRDVGGLSIMATYNAGSPWPGAAPRRDNRDMANIDARQLADELQDPRRRNAGSYSNSASQQTAGSFGDFSANRARFYEGHLDAEPLLCVNLWQHQWLPDYGLFGRRDYLTAWWDTIDWGVVENRVSLAGPVNDSRLRPSQYEPLMNRVQQDHSTV